MRRRTWISTFAAAALVCLATAAPLSACHMCKLATESTSRQPRAYMYSILFMLGMPAMISSGFGIAFYRLSRKAARMQQEAAAAWAAGLPPDQPGASASSAPSDPTRADSTSAGGHEAA